MTRVLIVDDASFMRHSIKLMLERNGFDVVGDAENGLVGLQKYKALNPDIVTMDITMPEMTGLESLKQIRMHDPRAKVIMVSAMGQETLVREAIMSGASSFIVKPFKEEYVIQALNKLATK